MSKKNNYNSIVFLTTLSVYLGLVLVGGATPSVFAQAALAKEFDIKNEIVFEDDLDKKPDEDLFASSIVDLINELNELSEQGIFDWNSKGEFQIESLGICESDNSPAFMGSGTINRKVDDALEKTSVKIARSYFGKLSNLNLGNLTAHTAEFKFVIDNGTLNIETEINANYHVNHKKDIQPFVDELTNYLSQITSNTKAAKAKIVAENTKITFENDQIFIVIRLPRGSIDALLAKKDTQ
ncbi:hypothetical protein BH10ACI1_BH10ACI1_00050 [soil metagenome]